MRETAVATVVENAIEKAVSDNLTSANAVVRNAVRVTADTLKNVAERFSDAAVAPKVSFDTVRGGAVVGRLTFDLTKVGNLSSDINLGVSTTNRTVSNVFNRFFSNETALVDLAHKAAFGTEIEVAVKVDLSNLNTENLVFYCYDLATNSYFQIQNPKYFIDANGYVHFSTNMGGSIIITDSALTRK